MEKEKNSQANANNFIDKKDKKQEENSKVKSENSMIINKLNI